MAKQEKAPAIEVRRLIRKLEQVPIIFSERTFIKKKGKKREVSGVWDGEEIGVNLRACRKWYNADTAVQIIVHELIHALDEAISEKDVLKLEVELFKKSRALREAILIKVVNSVLFDEPRKINNN